MSATLRTPSQSFSTSTAISSGASTRSGARITQTCRVSSNFSLAWRGSTGRLVSLTWMLRLRADAIDRLPLALFGNERSRRYMALDIGVVKGVELHPQNIGLEDQCIAHRLALGRGGGMGLDIVQRKAGIAWRLLQPAAEIAHDVGVDEIVVRQHARDALLMQVGREQFGQRRGDRLQRAS